jgi:hypothetical protein
MNLGIKRRKIEDKITACYEAVGFNAQKQAWVDSDAFEDFVFSYFELRRYYELSDDTTVGLEPIRVYMDAQRALKQAAADRKIGVDRRERAERLIYELTLQVEAVMYELDQNRQQAERDAGNGDGGIPILS